MRQGDQIDSSRMESADRHNQSPFEFLRRFRQRKFGRFIQHRLTCNLGTVLDFSAGGMAVRCMRGLPITFPATTGVAQPMRGGVLAGPRS